MLRVSEAGLAPGVWTEEKALPPSVMRKYDLNLDSAPLSLANLYPAFAISGVAYIASAALLVLELFVDWAGRRFCSAGLAK